MGEGAGEEHELLLEYVSIEKENIERSLSALEDALSKDEMTIIELSAIATFIHNTYSGMEMMLKRVLLSRDVPVPHTETSHKDLVQLSCEKGIVSEEMMTELDAYRAFRHFFVHGYGIMLEAEKLMPLAEGLPGLWSAFSAEVDEFLRSKD